MKCIVKNCNNKSHRRTAGVSFHRFPANEFERITWCNLIDVHDINVERALICSEHFLDCDLIRLATRTVLKEGATPIYIETNRQKLTNTIGMSTGSTFSTLLNREALSSLTMEICDTSEATRSNELDVGANGIDNTTSDLSSLHQMPVTCALTVVNPNIMQSSHCSGDSTTERVLVSDNEIADEVCDEASEQEIGIWELPGDANSTIQDVPLFDEAPKISQVGRLIQEYPFEDNSMDVDMENRSSLSFGGAKQHPEFENCGKATGSENVLIEKLKSKVKLLEFKLKHKSRLLHTLRQDKKRKAAKISGLSQLLSSLKEKNLICEGLSETLENIAGPNRQIIERQIFKGRNSTMSKTYCNEIKVFALNLNFLSPKAYEYVRTAFNNCLPHSRTLRKWYEKVGCKPGFTKESFAAIKKVVEATVNREQIFVNLVFDEISIRQHIDWDGERAHGYVDFGNDGISNTVATQILVFMAVFVNRPWKIPIGYFPIVNMNAEQKSNMVSLCIRNLIDTGVHVMGITFDGAPANFTMSKLLGSDVRDLNSQGFIKTDNYEGKIVLHPDPCHMLKLIRNALADLKILIDGDGQFIKWEYVVKLQQLQEKEGLHLANKLRKAHVYFEKQEMKVRLAVQTLSKSVADAIDFCRDILKCKEFIGSEGTSKFIRIFNDIFDVLNSRKISEYEFLKKALCMNNSDVVLQFSTDAIAYIKGLKSSSGCSIIRSKRNVGFLGLIAALRNLKVVYDTFIASSKLKFVPLYKLNQDHIELFFSSIRSSLGYNNNPTVKQFTASYKKLLFRCQLRDGGMGNCLPLEEIVVLNAQASCPLRAINDTIDRPAMLEDERIQLNEFDNQFLEEHNYVADPTELSEYANHVITYIAGFVVFKICKVLNCQQCISAIQGELSKDSLIGYKTRGLLKTPSESVVFICETAEKDIRRFQKCTDDTILTKQTLNSILQNVQVSCIGKELFDGHAKHMNETQHYSLLIKLIAEKYIHTRYYFIAKKQSEKISVRQYFNKLVHYKGM